MGILLETIKHKLPAIVKKTCSERLVLLQPRKPLWLHFLSGKNTYLQLPFFVRSPYFFGPNQMQPRETVPDKDLNRLNKIKTERKV